MLKKIEIPILVLAAILGLSGPAAADPDFSGSARLRTAVWRLAGFFQAREGAAMSLMVGDLPGLPPVSLTLTFGRDLAPWPESLVMTAPAGGGRPAFELTDRRPFGGPNLKIKNLPEALRSAGADPAEALTALAEKMGRALLAARPRLAPFAWREAAPGFEWARARLLYGARFGPDDLYLARFDPARHRFRPYQENEFPEPANLAGWAARLPSALALINGGQYYPDRRYMGRLSRDGRPLSGGDHARWRGFLVSGLRPGAPAGAPPAAIIDRERPEPNLDPDNYLDVMQSFMLLDSLGRPRVRDTFNLASRAAVAEDREGRLILIMTPAPISLYDLALVLGDPALAPAKALGLDGGLEAQMLLRPAGADLLYTGHFVSSAGRPVRLPGYQPSLPAALAVEPYSRERGVSGEIQPQTQ